MYKDINTSNQDIDKAIKLKNEIKQRIIYEQKLCETLNKIVAKLNFEKSEADHCAVQQKIEIDQSIKLKQSLC